MNTIKSVYYGWATLIVAGGGAYFFAKRSINADRAAKAELDRQKRIRQYELEYGHLHRPSSASKTPQQLEQRKPPTVGHTETESIRNPSVQASQDPAPPNTASEEESREKSKYEASAVYRSRKGDRFS